jgi:hypothetical protein
VDLSGAAGGLAAAGRARGVVAVRGVIIVLQKK